MGAFGALTVAAWGAEKLAEAPAVEASPTATVTAKKAAEKAAEVAGTGEKVEINAAHSFIALFDLNVEPEGDFDLSRKFLHARNSLVEIFAGEEFPLKPFAFKDMNRPRPDDSWAMFLNLQQWEMDEAGVCHFKVSARVQCGETERQLGTFSACSTTVGDPTGKPLYQLDVYREPAKVAFAQLYQAFDAQFALVGETVPEKFERGMPFRKRKSVF